MVVPAGIAAQPEPSDGKEHQAIVSIPDAPEDLSLSVVPQGADQEEDEDVFGHGFGIDGDEGGMDQRARSHGAGRSAAVRARARTPWSERRMTTGTDRAQQASLEEATCGRRTRDRPKFGRKREGGFG